MIQPPRLRLNMCEGVSEGFWGEAAPADQLLSFSLRLQTAWLSWSSVSPTSQRVETKRSVFSSVDLPGAVSALCSGLFPPAATKCGH